MHKVLIVGDIHLGRSLSLGKPGIGNILNSRIADQLKLLDWILDQAVNNEVTAIILTGDVFHDPKPDYLLLSYFISWLKKCECCEIDVHIITGNHDLKRVGAYRYSVLDTLQYAELSNCTIYKHINTIFVGTVGYTLVPFWDRKSLSVNTTTEAIESIKNILSYEIESIPCTYDKVLIGHMALEGSIIVGDELDEQNNELMCPPSMFAGYDYVWMGHVHRPQVRSKKPYIAHIGSLDISDFGETDHQKILILFDPQLPEKFKEIKVPTRPLRILKTSVEIGQDTTDVVLKGLEELDKKNPLRDSILKIEVQLCGAEIENANRNLIQNKLQEYQVHNLCNFTESRAVVVVPQEKKRDIDNTIDVKSAINMWAESIDENKDLFIKMAYEVISESL